MGTITRTRQTIEAEWRECCEARAHCQHDEYGAMILQTADALLDEWLAMRQ